MTIWLVHSGWTGNGSEGVFVEARNADAACARGAELFKEADPKREYTRVSAEPFWLERITECDGWAT
jgi:hypothetical protein